MSETPRQRSAVDALSDLVSIQRKSIARQDATARPWYFLAPAVVTTCLVWVMMPLTVLVRIAETVLALTVLAIVATVALWYTGSISDADVIQALLPLGQRILEMASSLSS